MKNFISFFFAFIFIASINAQTATIGGGASVACPAVPTATYTGKPVGVNISNWSRGSGVTCASAGNGLSGSGFNTASATTSFGANKYYSVTISSGRAEFDITQIVWNTAVSSGTPNFTIYYSLNGTATQTFGTAAQTSTTTNTFNGNVHVGIDGNVVFYLIPAGTSASGTTVRWINGSTITFANVLPINLTSLTATKNILNFRTEGESKNSHFEIERSTDGQNFTEISRIKGAGTTNLPQNYTFTDLTAPKGVNYYRLKQVDFDGRFEYSKTVQSNFGEKTLAINVINSNPSNLNLNVFSNQNDEIKFEIIDMQGRIVKTFQNEVFENENKISLDVSLENGIYILKANSSNGEQVSKMISIK
jgi:hypothetical protein